MNGLIYTTTGAADVWLVIGLAVMVLDLVAVARIIVKAGYSMGWIAVPLTPIVLTVTLWALLYHAATTDVVYGYASPVSVSNYAALGVLDGLSFLVAWIFFLVFAFSTWPVRRELGAQLARAPQWTQVPAPVPSAPPAQAPARSLAIGSPGASNSGVATGMLEATPTTCPQCRGSIRGTSVFCPYCGTRVAR